LHIFAHLKHEMITICNFPFSHTNFH
jgi:hypothetical protein